MNIDCERERSINRSIRKVKIQSLRIAVRNIPIGSSQGKHYCGRSIRYEDCIDSVGRIKDNREDRDDGDNCRKLMHSLI